MWDTGDRELEGGEYNQDGEAGEGGGGSCWGGYNQQGGGHWGSVRRLELGEEGVTIKTEDTGEVGRRRKLD